MPSEPARRKKSFGVSISEECAAPLPKLIPVLRRFRGGEGRFGSSRPFCVIAAARSSRRALRQGECRCMVANLRPGGCHDPAIAATTDGGNRAASGGQYGSKRVPRLCTLIVGNYDSGRVLPVSSFGHLWALSLGSAAPAPSPAAGGGEGRVLEQNGGLPTDVPLLDLPSSVGAAMTDATQSLPQPVRGRVVTSPSCGRRGKLLSWNAAADGEADSVVVEAMVSSDKRHCWATFQR